MKLYYQLPYLTYDFSNSKFIDFEFEEAVQLYKLLYKDIEAFHNEFLQRFELIPNLKPLSLQLSSDFNNASPISLEKLKKSSDVCLRTVIDYYDDFLNNTNSESSFYKSYIRKIKTFLNEDTSELYSNQSLASLSKKVGNKHPIIISKIDYYAISAEDEFVAITIRDIKTLESNGRTKYLVCNDCEIESIKLNEQLILLEAQGNKINSIELNQNLTEAVLSNNPLSYIKLNANLKTLYLSHPKNHIIEIDNSINNKEVEIYYKIN
ncbi:hypothetical protein [Flavobacterium sp.]|uniref:hypothetical protein n=1 Tax=Flavobacterium sp. TaxID=239 RepID=UPI0040487B6F